MDSKYGQFGVLSDSVQAFGVASRLRPTYVSIAYGPVEVGFELELRGLHECGFEHVLAGCAACRRLFFTLLEIADCVLPRNEARNDGEPPHERVTRYSHISRECPETILVIKITCITALNRIADGWMSAYIRDVRSVLRQLGCRELYWDNEAQDHGAREASADQAAWQTTLT